MKKYLHWYQLDQANSQYVIWIRYSDERDIEYMQITEDGERGEFKPLSLKKNWYGYGMIHGAVKTHMSGKKPYAWMPVTEEEFVLWLLGDTNG